MKIADEIRRRMQLLGLNAERLSLAAGLNKTYVTDILRNRARSPRLDNLAKLAEQLQCTVEELTGEDPPPPRREDKAQTDHTLMRQAYAVATRVTAEDDPASREETTFAIAAAIYDVVMERRRSGEPPADDAEVFVVIEAILRRIRLLNM